MKRIYIKIKCPTCGEERSIRKDGASHQDCKSCAGKKKWKDNVYKEKMSKAHIGYKMPNEQKKKISDSINKKLKEECFNKNALKKAIESHKRGYGESSLRWLYKSYQRSAKKRGIEFKLTQDEFKVCIDKNCDYCGEKPSNTIKDHEKRLNGAYKFNGIDRVNNNVGYISKNIVACCKKCNYAIHKMTKDEFIKHIIKIYNHVQVDSLGSRQETVK